MKTRKIISVLRAAVERAALAMLVLVIVVYAMRQYALWNYAVSHWYIGAALLIGYAVLTLSEDYLNRRIFRFGW